MEISDSSLLDRFRRKRDEAAFAELVRRHERMVTGTASRMLGGGSDAEDIAQAAFIALAMKPPRLPPSQSLGPWLHKVTVRAALDLRKRERRRIVREQQAAPAVPEAGREREVDLMLEKLPPKLARTLVAHYLEGWSIEELAAREHCAASAISMRLSRGRTQLRDRLKSDNAVMSFVAAAAMAQEPMHGFSETMGKVVSQMFAGTRSSDFGWHRAAGLARRVLRPSPLQVAVPGVAAAGMVGVAVAVGMAASSPALPSGLGSAPSGNVGQSGQSAREAALDPNAEMETRFDFFESSSAEAAKLVFGNDDNKALFEKLSSDAAASRGSMVLRSRSGRFVEKRDFADIKAEITVSPGGERMSYNTEIKYEDSALTTAYSAFAGECVLAGMIPGSAGGRTIFIFVQTTGARR